MRDPTALHVGLTVTTPNGPGIIRARRGGPVTTWLVLDFWWRESQLQLPDGPSPEPDRAHACIGCRRSGRPLSMSGGTHCHGHGGVIVDGEPRPCGCRCGTRWRDETGWI